MSELAPCKHLDYAEGNYIDCEIKTCAPDFPDVRYWLRGPTWTDGRRNPAKVQFCGLGRGRINSIFSCYNGEMHCYEPLPDPPEGPTT